MSQASIRLIKTPDVEQVIGFLKDRYPLLSDAEIIKLALSETYQKEKAVATNEQRDRQLREQFYQAIAEGGAFGDQLLANKGLSADKMTEQEIYDSTLRGRKRK